MTAHVSPERDDAYRPEMVHRGRRSVPPESSESIREFLAARRASDPTNPANVPDLAQLGEHGDYSALPPRRRGRYDMCDDTCTVDCGNFKGQGRPASMVRVPAGVRVHHDRTPEDAVADAFADMDDHPLIRLDRLHEQIQEAEHAVLDAARAFVDQRFAESTLKHLAESSLDAAVSRLGELEAQRADLTGARR